ncbi:hypothetical protein [Streptomyces sp. NPDC052114]|uniref:hypothetical protein n=1 Tax=unclassified Streptomyces TaxID=2593676 RepID=UPI00342C2657
MAVRFGPGPDRVPGWVFAVVGFVLVVGVFFGMRGLASPGGGARGGGGSSGSADGGSDSASGGQGDAGGSGANGGSDGGFDAGSDGGDTSGSSGGSSNGTWQNGGTDGGRGKSKGDGKGGGGGTPPGWLPWGPRSPNTDEALEPDSAYDLLQEVQCQEAYDTAVDPAKQRGDSGTPESWKVIEGLAGICKAARGESGGLAIAEKAATGLRAVNYHPAGTEQLCKDGDAYGVLQRFVAYYRRHADERVVLRHSTSGSNACTNTLAASDARYAPGTPAYFNGTWPDAPRSLELRAPELARPIVLDLFGDTTDQARCCKDAAVSVNLPGPDGYGGERPTAIDVTLVTEKGARVVKRGAFELDWSGIDPPSPKPPSPGPPSPEPPSPRPPSPRPPSPRPGSSSPEASSPEVSSAGASGLGASGPSASAGSPGALTR